MIEQEAQRGMTRPYSPPLAPFHSNDWPWQTDPTKGKGPSTSKKPWDEPGAFSHVARGLDDGGSHVGYTRGLIGSE